MKSCILLAIVLSMVCHIGIAVDVRLVDLDPPEAQQHIDSHDTTLHYAPKVDSNVPATRVLGNEPTQVLEDIYLANQYHGQDGLGGYLYGYAVPDIAKTERKQAGGDLTGAYNYVSGDGQEIKVKYWDDGTGFHQTDNVPRIQPQQIPDTPEVQAAKAEHARIWAEQAERNSHPIADPNANYRPGQTNYNLPQQQNYLGQGSQNAASYQPPPNNQFGQSHVKNQAQAGGNKQSHGSSAQAPAHYGGTAPQQGAAGQQQYGGQQQGPAGQQQYGGYKQGGGAPQQGAEQQNAGQQHYGGNQPGSAGQQQYGPQSTSGQQQHGAAGQQQYGRPQPGSAGQQQYGPQSTSGQQQHGSAGQQQYGSQSASGQQQHGAAGQQQYGTPQPGSAGQQQQHGAAAGQQQYGSQSTSGQQQQGAAGQQQYNRPQPGSAGQQQYGTQSASGQQQYGSQSAAGQQQHGGQQPGGASQNQFGGPQSGGAGQKPYGSQFASGQQQYGGAGQQNSGAGPEKYGGSQTGAVGQQQYGGQQPGGVGPQPGSAGQHYAVTGQPHLYGGQQQHGGQQNVPYSGQHSEVKSTYASAAHGGGTGDGEYKPNPNEDNGEYKASSDEEQGPPKGFWYNFDYPVGIIVSKQGSAAPGGHQPQPYKRAAGLGSLYEENKKIFEGQLKNGGIGVAGGSYQVHA